MSTASTTHTLQQYNYSPVDSSPAASLASSARRELMGMTRAVSTFSTRLALSDTNCTTSCTSPSLLKMSTCKHTQTHTQTHTQSTSTLRLTLRQAQSDMLLGCEVAQSTPLPPVPLGPLPSNTVQPVTEQHKRQLPMLQETTSRTSKAQMPHKSGVVDVLAIAQIQLFEHETNKSEGWWRNLRAWWIARGC